MPNRIIKESIRTSDSINDLTWFEEVLFYRLMVSCDDYGRFDARIPIIKGSCFPLKNVTDNQIENALNKLSSAGIVTTYTVEEKPYLQIVAWEKHQTIRAKKSKYPSLDEADAQIITHESTCKQMISDVPVIQSNPNPNPNTINTLCKADANALFERLWKAYPNKRGKAKCPMQRNERSLRLARRKCDGLWRGTSRISNRTIGENRRMDQHSLIPGM